MADRAAILNKQTLYRGWMKILRVRAQIESNEVEREVEDHGRAVAVLPYDAQRRMVLLARQVRVAVLLCGHPSPLLEVAAGMVEHDHSHQTALREASEELGLHLKTLEHAGGAWTSPGVSTEFMDLYLAPYTPADRVSAGGGLASEHEKIAVMEMPIHAVWQMLERQEIADMKTLTLVLLLRSRHPELFDFSNKFYRSPSS
jgi:nudix-type nucleoside diphosphatase (YffH/AdpP family)